jgi:tRNA A-37 threonylcarbamoyl transferase component Bud32
VELAVGDAFGRYQVLAPIGSGGMAHVYRAHDTILDRSVALKILRQDREDDDDAVARFDREARMAARLTHPNTIRVYDVGEVQATPFIAMEWVDGHPLSVLARHHDVSRDRLLGMLLGAGRGLAAAHDLKLVHRDVKPSNIMVTREDVAKIVDFGLVKRHSTSARVKKLTGTGWILGTPQYMAPEQLETADVDARADQFSWGMTAFVVLSRGFHPRDHLGGFGPRVPRIDDYVDVPRAIADVIERAMQNHPKDRFASMAPLIEALETALVTARVHLGGAPAPAVTTGLARRRVLYCPGCASHLDEDRRCKRCGYEGGGGQPSLVPIPPAPTLATIVEHAAATAVFERASTLCPIAPIVAGAFAGDGSEATAIGRLGMARWRRGGWELEDRTLTGFAPERARCMAYLADGTVLVGGDASLVVTIGADGAMTKWTVGLLGAERVVLLAIDPSDRTLVGIGPGGNGVVVRVYDRGTITAFVCPTPLTGVARASNGSAYACGPNGHLCLLADFDTHALSTPAGLDFTTMIAAGNVVFATGGAGSVCRIDVDGERKRERADTNASIEVLAASRNVAWGATSQGEILRRDAGDPHWRIVWRAPASEPFRAVAMSATEHGVVALGADGSVLTGCAGKL